MSFSSFYFGNIRTSARFGIGIGAVAMYYDAGLWKNGEETIKNYDTLKRETDGFINSVPVIRDIFGDMKSYGSNLIAPATKVTSSFLL